MPTTKPSTPEETVVLLTWPEVFERVKVSSSQVRRMEREGKFPLRVLLFEGGRAVRWKSDEIDHFIASREGVTQK